MYNTIYKTNKSGVYCRVGEPKMPADRTNFLLYKNGAEYSSRYYTLTELEAQVACVGHQRTVSEALIKTPWTVFEIVERP